MSATERAEYWWTPDLAPERLKHHPGLYATGRHGCWSRCSCSWESRLFTTVTGAHLAFGQHLAEASQ